MRGVQPPRWRPSVVPAGIAVFLAAVIALAITDVGGAGPGTGTSSGGAPPATRSPATRSPPIVTAATPSRSAASSAIPASDTPTKPGDSGNLP